MCGLSISAISPGKRALVSTGADVKVVQQMLGHGSATMTLDTYGHLFHDRLDEVADAMTAARDAERALHARAGVASVLPKPPKPENGEGALPSVSAGQGPFRTGTPDRIRTGATALRGRRARPLHNGGLQPARDFIGHAHVVQNPGLLTRRYAGIDALGY